MKFLTAIEYSWHTDTGRATYHRSSPWYAQSYHWHTIQTYTRRPWQSTL